MEASWTLASARFKFARYDQAEVLLGSCTQVLVSPKTAVQEFVHHRHSTFPDVDALITLGRSIVPMQQDCWRRKQLEECLSV